MVTNTLMPVEEYLATRFDGPAPEYIDGQLVERSVPTFSHGELQGNVHAFFKRIGNPYHPATELDVQTGAGRIRVLDVGVFHGQKPASRENVPLIAIEILSPGDVLGKLIDRFEELRDAGIKHLWLVDPVRKTLHRFGKHGIVETDFLEIAELQLRMTPADIFD